MSLRGTLILGVLFVIAFALLGLGQCGYKKIKTLQTIENSEIDIRQNYPSVDGISADTLTLLQESGRSILLIDVRDAEEFSVSHLEEAVNLTDVEQVERYLRAQPEAPEALVLYGALGYRAAKLGEQLQEAGVSDVKLLQGSIFLWANEDRELVNNQGDSVIVVHPYNRHWEHLLEKEHRAEWTGNPDE